MSIALRRAEDDGPPPSERRAELARRGFLAIDQFLDPQDVNDIRAIAEKLFKTKAGFTEGRYVNIVGHDDGEPGRVLPQILQPRFSAAALKSTSFFAKAEELARELIGPQATFLFDHLIMKPKLDGAETPWHQDEAYEDPAFDHSELSIWLPLQPVDGRNGAMRFIPGSNRGEVLPHRAPDGDDTIHGLECCAGFDPADAVLCPLPLGGATVHLGRTVHGSGPNATTEPRYAYILVFEGPKIARSTPRSFPWQERKTTAAMARGKDWAASPAGLAVQLFRKVFR